MRLTIVLGLAACGAACAPRPENEKPAPAEPALVSVSYEAWNEAIRVDAVKGTLVHTQTEYEYADPTSSVPSGQTTRTLADGPVSRPRIDALARAIREAGFLGLKERYGAPEGRRYYPHRLAAQFEGAPRKEVEFRSNPEYEGEPEAFKSVVKRLRDLAEAVRGK
jgi:hypothetical protein